MNHVVAEVARFAQIPFRSAYAAPLLQYLRSGLDTDLRQLPKPIQRYDYNFLYSVWYSMSQCTKFLQLDEAEFRFLRAAAHLEQNDDLTRFFHEQTRHNPQNTAAAPALLLRIFADAPDARVKAAGLIMSIYDLPLVEPDGRPNPWGEFLLSLTDEELRAAGELATHSEDALALFIARIPERIPAIGESYLEMSDPGTRCLSHLNCELLLKLDAQRYLQPILRAIAKQMRLGRRCVVLEMLVERFPGRFDESMRHTALKSLRTGDRENGGDVEKAFAWLLKHEGTAIFPELLPHLREDDFHYVVSHLRIAAQQLGSTAAPLFAAAIENPDLTLRCDALAKLIDWELPEYDDLIVRTIQSGFDLPKNVYQVHWQLQFLKLAARRHAASVAPALWKFLDNKSKQLRVAAALALAKVGEGALKQAVGVLNGKKAASRSAAVTLLSALGTDAALAALEARVDLEPDDEVRDQILLVLDKLWQAQGRRITRADIEQRIARTAGKLTAPTADWLDEAKLPPLRFAGDATPLPLQTVRYLLYRQSRAKEMRSDIEAKPLFEQLDRSTSGDCAAYLLRAFLVSPTAADDRWAMSAAALLGDDRLVAPLLNKIRDWVEAGRGKMAEYAAETLALLGTDAALCAVDALSIRYASKQKNIGKAAAEAFASAAERLGITVDELGDRVVPWLGFEPEKPRLIEADGKSIEVRLGPDFKLEYRDTAKGKKVASLPAWVPAEVKNEFKELAVTLREVVKGQLARVENLMVRQFRWPIVRWRELYLHHPLLFPFAARMIWAQYDDGRRIAMFHALEDHTLTDAADTAVVLSETGSIGLIHPLELSPEERAVWLVHLADYSITSPVLQLERPVSHVKPADAAVRISTRFEDVELNAMTFKGRVDRMGWQRGSVCDGGSIPFYYKTFPGAGVDALLHIDGMYIGIDVASSIKLGKIYFVRSASVEVGSYTYDEPKDDKDARLIPLGEVPPVVYSETFGDVVRISGKEEPAEAETA